MSGRILVPEDSDLRDEILSQAHMSKLSIHPGSMKLYKDLRTRFWWKDMKRSVYQFLAKYLVCQQVKAEHRRLGGLLQNLSILEWKWKHVTIDFVIHLSLSSKNCDTIWIVVDRLTKSTHFIPFSREYSFDRMTKLYIQEILKYMMCQQV